MVGPDGQEEAPHAAAASPRPGAEDPHRVERQRREGQRRAGIELGELGARQRAILYGVAGSGIVALIVVVLLVVLGGGSSGAKAAAKTLVAAGCTYKQYPAQPRTPHYTTLNPTPKPSWNSYPPTSGRHFYQWVLWGDYTEPVPLIKEVHNLEHGGMIIQYGNKVPKIRHHEDRRLLAEGPDRDARRAAAEPRQQDRDDRVDELGRVHDVQPEGVQGLPVGVPLPRPRVAHLPEELASAGNVTRLA